MTNRGSLSGLRTGICHLSLVIFSGAALGRDGAKHGESARAKGSKTGNASIGAHSEVTPGAFLASDSGKIFGQQLRLSLPGREILYFACDRRPGSIFQLQRRPDGRLPRVQNRQPGKVRVIAGKLAVHEIVQQG